MSKPKRQTSSIRKPNTSVRKQTDVKRNLLKTNQTKSAKTSVDMAGFFDKNLNFIFIVSILLQIVLSLLLFDIRVSLSGDDSAYMIRAYNFIHDFTYPEYQGPLYPIVLSPFVALFGFNLTVLKFLSLILMLGHHFFLYKAFKGRIPSVILAGVLVISSLNAYMLFHASSTYNEALYFFIQSLYIWVFFSFFVADQEKISSLKTSYKYWLLLGAVAFLLGLTRSIGYGVVFVSMVFFALHKNWKAVAYVPLSFIAFLAPFEVVKKMIWGGTGIMNSQVSVHLQKDFYNPVEGFEDIGGFLYRIVFNSNVYLSKHFPMFMGFRADDVTIPSIGFLTILMYLAFAAAMFFVFKKNKYLMYTGLFSGMMSFATFVILQTVWDQSRLVLIFYPLVMLFLFAGIYYAAEWLKRSFAVAVVLLLITVVVFGSLSRTFEKVDKHSAVLKHTLSGDDLYGLTPDWKNYLSMAKWAAKNIPEDKIVACRKPSVAFVFSTRKFHGIWRLPMQPIEELRKELKEKYPQYIAIDLREWSNKNIPSNIKATWQKRKIAYFTATVNTQDHRDISATSFEIYEMQASDTLLLNGFGAKYYKQLDKLMEDQEQLPDRTAEQYMAYNIVNADQLLKDLRDSKVDYVIMASLRKFENRKTNYTINTIRRYLFYVQEKYPGIFQQIRVEGQDEQAYLFKVNYEVANMK